MLDLTLVLSLSRKPAGNGKQGYSQPSKLSSLRWIGTSAGHNLLLQGLIKLTKSYRDQWIQKTLFKWPMTTYLCNDGTSLQHLSTQQHVVTNIMLFSCMRASKKVLWICLKALWSSTILCFLPHAFLTSATRTPVISSLWYAEIITTWRSYNLEKEWPKSDQEQWKITFLSILKYMR